MNITLSDELYASLQASTIAMDEAYKAYMACPTSADSSLALVIARENYTVAKKGHDNLCVSFCKAIVEKSNEENK